ncbi:MAG: PTS system mannose/fructose/sorbose family transporter subunit IID [Candidatus Adiutrix sp.]|nr:PTS system mannose/fructose/sorbose family transporter subunit IID [Candidatus Adiutrix sp.]
MKFLTLANIAFRSFFLEASWNNQGQQNLGLAAAIDPALKRLYHSAEGLRAARERALEYFNTNPVASGVAIGVILKLEGDVAAGRLNPEDRLRVASSLSRTLAAMGDSFFWQSWLPLCCLTAVWADLSLSSCWTPLLLPLLFCLPALPVRLAGLYLGYRRGEDIIDLLFRLKIQRRAQGVRRALALVVGASTVILLGTKTALADSLGRLWLTVGAVLFSVICLRFLSRRAGRLNYWYPLIMVGLAAVLLFFLKRG